MASKPPAGTGAGRARLPVLQTDTSGNLADAAVHYHSCLTFEPTNKFCIFNLGVQAQNAGRPLEGRGTRTDWR